MSLATPLETSAAWKALTAHRDATGATHLRDLFARDAGRGGRITVKAAGLYLDYSKQRVDDETMRLLVALAEERGLRERTTAMFRGDVVNQTERRSVLHVALRKPKGGGWSSMASASSARSMPSSIA
jgi:glucose-6-phosphate isomerase